MPTRVRRILLWGVAYALVGLLFGELAGRASSHTIRTAWRLAAFAVSGVLFVWHVGFEHGRTGSAARTTALRASLAVALGAFCLAVAANIHELRTAATPRLLLVLSLVIWPLMAALPAFVVAWVAALALARVRRT